MNKRSDLTTHSFPFVCLRVLDAKGLLIKLSLPSPLSRTFPSIFPSHSLFISFPLIPHIPYPFFFLIHPLFSLPLFTYFFSPLASLSLSLLFIPLPNFLHKGFLPSRLSFFPLFIFSLFISLYLFNS